MQGIVTKMTLSPHSWWKSRFFRRGPFLEVPRTFWAQKPVVKLQSACFEKLIFSRVFNVRKTKRLAKFDSLEPRRCEDVKGIVGPERDPKSFGTFEKQALETIQLEVLI